MYVNVNKLPIILFFLLALAFNWNLSSCESIENNILLQFETQDRRARFTVSWPFEIGYDF